MEFTGERLVPGAAGLEELYLEHMSRYLLAAGLAPESRVLDAGCGCGYGAHYLALAGASEVLGIDISPEAVEYAAGRYAHPRLSYRVMDVRRIEADRPYDLITCFELIEHVDEDARVLESLAGALAVDGVCLISTPNADTYVAGGTDGSNPFHFREYRFEEFERLLRGAFGAVEMLEQRWVDAVMVLPAGAASPAGAAAPEGVARLVPEGPGKAPEDGAFGPASYFIAVCRKSASPPAPESLSRPFAACAGNIRYARLREEFDRRGAWARKLDEENAEKDARIRRLTEEKRDLEKQFDERGRWAQGLDAGVRERDGLIEKLLAENERLKKAAGLPAR